MFDLFSISKLGILRMNMVPITANITVKYFEIIGAESGMPTKTAKETNVHITPRIIGLILRGIPLPSR